MKSRNLKIWSSRALLRRVVGLSVHLGLLCATTVVTSTYKTLTSIRTAPNYYPITFDFLHGACAFLPFDDIFVAI